MLESRFVAGMSRRCRDISNQQGSLKDVRSRRNVYIAQGCPWGAEIFAGWRCSNREQGCVNGAGCRDVYRVQGCLKGSGMFKRGRT